jgi:hypothetical protein
MSILLLKQIESKPSLKLRKYKRFKVFYKSFLLALSLENLVVLQDISNH